MDDVSKPRVLILSVPGDLHAAAVKWALQSQGVPSEVIFLGDLPDHSKISIQIGRKNAAITFRDRTGHEVECSDVEVVWNRRIAYPPAPPQVHEHDSKIVTEAYRHHVNNVRSLLTRQAQFVNSPDAQHLANSKSMQLATAADIGFRIPDTCISNDFDKAISLQRRYESTIFKMYYARLWRNEGTVFGAFTRRIDALTEDDRRAVQLCPAFYQEAIDHRGEVRVVAIGLSLFGMKMKIKDDSQSGPSAGLDDSRLLLHYGSVDCIAVEIPKEVVSRVRAYLDVLKLRYGAFDFLISPTGEWVFLECNEGGQFLFLEDRLPELPLLKVFTDYLCSLCRTETPQSADADGISLKRYYQSDNHRALLNEMDRHNDFPAYAQVVEESPRETVANRS